MTIALQENRFALAGTCTIIMLSVLQQLASKNCRCLAKAWNILNFFAILAFTYSHFMVTHRYFVCVSRVLRLPI